MFKSLCFFSLACLLWLGASPVFSDEPAIRKSVDAYTAAFNRGDVEAMATSWTDNGVWIKADGSRTEGLAAIREVLAAGQAGKGVLEIVESKIRMVTPSVAIEEGTARLSISGNVVGEERYEAVHVATTTGWKLSSLRELSSGQTAETGNPNLAELAWMVGDWIDESADARIVSRVEWSRNQAFLVNNFSAEFSGEQESLEGVQVIGWDPARGVIRSWMFDSDGALGEGTWQPRNGTWVVRSNITLSDGRQASSTMIYTPQDENSYVWQAIGRKVDGQFLPNIPKVRVVRQGTVKPAGETSAAPEAKSPEANPAPAATEGSAPETATPTTATKLEGGR